MKRRFAYAVRGRGRAKVRPSRILTAFAAGASALALAACGSSSTTTSTKSTTGSGSGASSTTTSSGATGSAALSSAASQYAPFTGGTAGKAASGTPINIGFINNQGGVPSFPDATAAADVAVQFVNAQLGGVGGHPVKLVSCFPLTEGQGQTCAQQFLNDSSINLIIDGVTPVGSASFFQTIGGKKPVIEAVPATPNDVTAKHAYGISSGGFAAGNDATYIAQDLKAKTVGVLGASDDPGSVAAVNVLKTALQKLGVKVTVATFTTTSSDLLPALSASGGNKNDVIYMDSVSTPNCISAAKAAQQAAITKPIVGVNACVTSVVKQALGDFPKWTTRWNQEDPYAPGSADLKAYNTVMATYNPKAEIAGTAGTVFSAVMVAVKMLDQAGSAATPTSLESDLSAFKGPAPMLPPNLKFGGIPGTPALGTLASRMYTYMGNGQWKDASGWINAG
jgi:branched-chain amino acid transport system substrate-binding protein